MADLQYLLRIYRRQPPASRRARALLLEEIWAARTKADQERILGPNAHRKCPELEPLVSTTVVRVSQVLLSGERKGFDLSGCWQLWDANPTISPRVLTELFIMARKHAGGLQSSPGAAFDAALDKLLLQRGLRTKRENPSVPPKQQSTPIESHVITFKVCMSLRQLAPREQRLVAIAAADSNVSESEYVTSLVESAARDDSPNLVEFVARQVNAGAARVLGTLLEGSKDRSGKPKPSSEKEASRNRAKKKVAKKKVNVKQSVHVKPVADEQDGRVPPLHERLRIVVGKDQVTINQAIDRLRAHNPSWLPDSQDLNAYISLAMSTHKNIFQRVTRGIYCVRDDAPRPTGRRTTPQRSKRPPAPAQTAFDLGSNIMDNPFEVAAAE